MGPDGELEALDEDEPGEIAKAIEELDPESVAVCLLFSYLDASHEERIADEIRSRIPGLHVSASHEVLPRFREYERTSTTVVDAYLSPLLGRYLSALADASRFRGDSRAGDHALIRRCRALAGGSPAGCMERPLGPGRRRRRAPGSWLAPPGTGDAVGLDMGGTSCDVCVIEDGRAQITESREIGGRVIQLPMVDVHTVGAGGGSIGWVDHGGALRVGPKSAGADPGPACYGRGGTDATVTDANLVLGRLAPGSSLAGELELDPEAASAAVDGTGRATRAR